MAAVRAKRSTVKTTSNLVAKRTRRGGKTIDESSLLPVPVVVPVVVPVPIPVPVPVIVPANLLNNGSSASSSSVPPNVRGNKLMFKHYDRPCVTLAKELLGKKIVRKLESGKLLSGHIVETEAYVGVEDKAAHSYGGKEIARTKAMFMAPGTAYVYNIYGIYTCINISSQGAGNAVLIRALDPVDGIDEMRMNRSRKGEKQLKDTELCNGPSKLTMALKIDKQNTDQADLPTCTHIWLEDGFIVADADIVESVRIGLSRSVAKEWTDKLLRFYVRGNKSVSKRDKIAETNCAAANTN